MLEKSGLTTYRLSLWPYVLVVCFVYLCLSRAHNTNAFTHSHWLTNLSSRSSSSHTLLLALENAAKATPPLPLPLMPTTSTTVATAMRRVRCPAKVCAFWWTTRVAVAAAAAVTSFKTIINDSDRCHLQTLWCKSNKLLYVGRHTFVYLLDSCLTHTMRLTATVFDVRRGGRGSVLGLGHIYHLQIYIYTHMCIYNTRRRRRQRASFRVRF